MYTCVCAYVTLYAPTIFVHGGQRRDSDPLGLWLQATTWVLGI